MQRRLLKLSWYPFRGSGAPALQRCHTSCPKRKVSGPLETRNRQLLEDNQREGREDRRCVAQVPIGLRHRVYDMYKSGNTPVAAAQEAGGHHEVSFSWGVIFDEHPIRSLAVWTV
jgi:hypothetical protein